MTKKVGYIMSRFPHLPETFILREMCEIERQGWQVELFPLIIQKQLLVHEDVKHWLPRVHRMPLISARIFTETALAIKRHPRKFFSLWFRVVRENIASPRVLIRAMAVFPKAIYAARLMSDQGIGHIHAHYATYPALAAWIIHHLTGISYSITVHAHDIYVDRSMLSTKLRDASFIAAISEFNRDFLVRHVGEWVHDKIRIVHCGIQADTYRPCTEPTSRGSGEFRIISIGSLQAYKGYVHLLRACALIKARGIAVACSIIGGGEEKEALQKEIKQLDLEDTVRLLGPRQQDEVATLLPEADCYVQPSIVTPSGKMEGIPVAIMEAMACGLPVVATEISGVPELVRHGHTGYLVKPANPVALAECLIEVYENPKIAAQYAEEGRRLVLEEFELSANVRRLAKYFDECVTESTLTGNSQFETANVE
jgi:colanic acid/amylovoran biosynthesis glycosyltransferase